MSRAGSKPPASKKKQDVVEGKTEDGQDSEKKNRKAKQDNDNPETGGQGANTSKKDNKPKSKSPRPENTEAKAELGKDGKKEDKKSKTRSPSPRDGERINTETKRDESKEKTLLESPVSPSREFKISSPRPRKYPGNLFEPQVAPRDPSAVNIEKEEAEKKLEIAKKEKEFKTFACTLEAPLIPALRRIGIRDIEGLAHCLDDTILKMKVWASDEKEAREAKAKDKKVDPALGDAKESSAELAPNATNQSDADLANMPLAENSAKQLNNAESDAQESYNDIMLSINKVRSLTEVEKKQLENLHERCRRKLGLPTEKPENKVKLCHNEAQENFKALLGQHKIPDALQEKLKSEGFDKGSKMAQLHGAHLRTALLGIRYDPGDNDGKVRELTEDEKTGLKEVWTHCRRDVHMPEKRNSTWAEAPVSPGRFRTDEKSPEPKNVVQDRFIELADQCSLKDAMRKHLEKLNLNEARKLARLKVPGDFRGEVLNTKYDPGDGNPRSLTGEEKQQLVQILNLSRQAYGLPPCIDMLGTLSASSFSPRQRNLTSPFFVTKGLEELAESCRVDKDLLGAVMAQTALRAPSEWARLNPVRFQEAVLTLSYAPKGKSQKKEIEKQDKLYLIDLYNKCREQLGLPPAHILVIPELEDVAMDAQRTASMNKFEHSLHVFAEQCGIGQELEAALASRRLDSPIVVARENFKMHLRTFKYDPDGNGLRNLNEKEMEQLMRLHVQCRKRMGWPVRDDGQASDTSRAELAAKPMELEQLRHLATKCGIRTELVSGLLKIGLNSPSTIARLRPAEFRHNVLAIQFNPGDGMRNLTPEEKQQLMHLFEECRKIKGLPTHRSFEPSPEDDGEYKSVSFEDHVSETDSGGRSLQELVDVCGISKELSITLQLSGCESPRHLAKMSPTEFKNSLLRMRYCPGESTGLRFLTDDEKEQLNTLYSECRLDRNLPIPREFLQADQLFEFDRNSPFRRNTTTPEFSFLALEMGLSQHLIDKLAEHGFNSITRFAHMRAPTELELCVLRLRYDPGDGHRELDEEETELLKLLYEECRLKLGLTTGFYFDINDNGSPISSRSPSRSPSPSPRGRMPISQAVAPARPQQEIAEHAPKVSAADGTNGDKRPKPKSPSPRGEEKTKGKIGKDAKKEGTKKDDGEKEKESTKKANDMKATETKKEGTKKASDKKAKPKK